MTARRTAALLLAALALLPAGCEKIRAAADRSKAQNDLKQIALAMLNYHAANQAMPPDAATLLKFDPELAAGPAGEKVRNGEVELIFDFKLADQTEAGTANTLMGWSAAPVFAPNVGLIFCDGTVKIGTPNEYEEAKRPVIKRTLPGRGPPAAAPGPAPKPAGQTRPTRKTR